MSYTLIGKHEKDSRANRDGYVSAMLELMEQDSSMVHIDCDLMGCINTGKLQKAFPNQTFNAGIAEQNAVGIAAGLSHSGKKVVCCGPACFYVARALEQIKVDVAYSRNPVKIFGVSGGFAYGALGSTHHSLHDIAVLRAFPGMNILIPSDGHMAAKAARTLIGYPEPIYIRVGRGATGEVYENDVCD